MKTNNLKKAMDDRGISVNDACKAGFPWTTIWSTYHGTRCPSAELAIELSKKLNIPKEEIRPDIWDPNISNNKSIDSN